jgi:3-isopropylmalate/(R)-2-methylmalate dehydratase small subunit
MIEKFTKFTGRAVPLFRANIDTDQIIPKQFLKRIERSGYGEFLFYDWRFEGDGKLREFVLNDARYSGGSILITGENFGCGSSREHAPWSILDYGFKAVIAPSFADIFYNNSLKNGLLPIILDAAEAAQLSERSSEDPDHLLTIDLECCTVTDIGGTVFEFSIDAFHRFCLMNGFDEIGLTLRHEDAISRYEKRSVGSDQIGNLLSTSSAL